MRSSVSHLARRLAKVKAAVPLRATGDARPQDKFMMMHWLVCSFMLALGVRAWQVGPAAQRLAVSSARAEAGEENAAADAIAAADAELCAEATRVAWAELEDVRARAARTPCKAPKPNAELLRLVDKLGQSRRYIAYLKLHRTELRRLSTRTVLALSLIHI